MPKPRDNETKEDFIERCMGNEEMNRKFPSHSQRRAVCEDYWEEE